MTAGFSIALAVTAILILLARLAIPRLPLRGAAARMTVVDSVLFGLGLLGLVFHCTAMFYRGLLEPVPGAQPIVDMVNSMGVASIILFAVPSLLLLLGLRHQHVAAIVAMAIALLAVGVTMYNGGTLQVHLAAIFVSGIVLASVMSFVVMPPWQQGLRSPVLSQEK